MNDISELSELPAYLYELGYEMGIKDKGNSVIVTASNSESGKFLKYESDDLNSALQTIKISVTLAELKGEMTIEKYLVMADGLTDRDKAYCQRILPELLLEMNSLQKEDLLNRSMSLLDPYSTDHQEHTKSVALLGVIKEYFERINAKDKIKEINDCLSNKIEFVDLSVDTLKMYVSSAEYRERMVKQTKHDEMLQSPKAKLSVVKS